MYWFQTEENMYEVSFCIMWGNLIMALFSIPIGAVLGLAGIFAGAAASFIEHFTRAAVNDLHTWRF